VSADASAAMPSAKPRRGEPRALDEGALATVIGYQITLANLATRKLFMRHVGEPMKLKPVDYTILMLLLANDDVTQKRLCETLNLSAPNLTILLDALQERDLVMRVRSETDRRSQRLHLTRKGEALARKARDVSATMEQDLQRQLSVAERAMLIELLQKVASPTRAD
jgi:DNA-binding MarR family transcriptional regulator